MQGVRSRRQGSGSGSRSRDRREQARASQQEVLSPQAPASASMGVAGRAGFSGKLPAHVARQPSAQPIPQRQATLVFWLLVQPLPKTVCLPNKSGCCMQPFLCASCSAALMLCCTVPPSSPSPGSPPHPPAHHSTFRCPAAWPPHQHQTGCTAYRPRRFPPYRPGSWRTQLAGRRCLPQLAPSHFARHCCSSVGRAGQEQEGSGAG